MMNAITGEGQIDIHHNNDAIIESEIMLEQTGAVKIEVHFLMNLDSFFSSSLFKLLR